MKKILMFALAALTLGGAAIQPATGAVVFSGSQQRGQPSEYYAENLVDVFAPNSTATVITGTLDITELLSGDTLLMGLIDKDFRDEGGYRWQSGAYLYLSMIGSTSMRFGVSDGNGVAIGELTQVFQDVSRANSVDFVLTIAGGNISLTSTLLAGTLTDAYGVVKTLGNNSRTGFNNGSGVYPWDEFANGAYLGTSMYFNSAQTDADRLYNFQTTAVGAVPLPAAAWLLLSGLGGLGFVGRRRRTA